MRLAELGVLPLITIGTTDSPTLLITEKAAQWIQALVQAKSRLLLFT